MVNLNKPRVGIVTCTKNRPVLLRRALANILEQKFQDWHLYLVNDGGDRTELEQVLRSFDGRFQNRLTLLHRETSGGIGVATNTGLRECREEFIAIHEDDDTWAPEFLETCVGRLDRDEKYGAAVARCYLVHEKLEGDRVVEVKREIYNEWQKSFISFFRMAETLTYTPICFLVRKSVLDKIGFFREDLPVLMDWDFALRMFREKDVLFIPELLANYHRRVDASAVDANANTLTSIPESYGTSDTQIRNDWIRKDLQEDRLSMGLLLTLGQAHGHLYSELAQVKAQLSRIEKLLGQKL